MAQFTVIAWAYPLHSDTVFSIDTLVDFLVILFSKTCVFSVDFIIKRDTFVCDRNIMKPDKNNRYCVYCGLQAVGICRLYFSNMVIVSLRISRLRSVFITLVDWPTLTSFRKRNLNS